MTELAFDVVVIGGGPAGYVCAIRAAQLGLNVACVEKRNTLGGTCLNVGCIPSKALLNSSYLYEQVLHGLGKHGIQTSGVDLDLKTMLQRKNDVVSDLTKGIDFLFKKNKVTRFFGAAEIVSDHQIRIVGEEEKILSAQNIVIATGSEPTEIPGIPVDEMRVVSSTGALSLEKVPDHLVVIGGGYIGLEMGSVWQRLGSKVTVVEYLDRIVPAMDDEVGKAFKKILEKQGFEFKLSTKVAHVEAGGSRLQVALEAREGGAQELMACDVLLVSAGRRPYTKGLGLEAVSVRMDPAGRVDVDAHFKTSCPSIYAIGDVIRGPMLAHKAEEEGVAVAEIIAGKSGHVNYEAIPGVVYTHPEVATVGKTEEQLKESGVDYMVGKFPFSANSRARANGDTDGFVKILTDRRTDRVLGVHIIGPEAGTLIAEAVLAMEYHASAEDIARTCHAHPALNEAVKEAAMAAGGRAIHA
ncbi:MAG: dihydrolipoyl dehydrogenase [Alphaproteobacteria bacterium]|nr:dihydrolipoyl dehydrogenase [Alphaproteobacteria bacterium]